ncbi:General vesicular transport factor p115 [Psilocybe cubensis]|uniref:General vesicular transport factor p115 n=2 Tax=Psilocybe cubensis TaxID=181762 RepID=A0ACB8HDR1_PSICU|nr:General vesicular transport factor p115 [Psilocybe cubensis]KAH9485606.1 General vesicular transport factor p115 [Psilocybe cubensis]
MEFFSQTYVALRGPTGAPQTPTEIISKLSDRLSPATLLADRRAAVLSLKGLARDCRQEVGEMALPGLLDVLFNDAEVDAEIGKAVLETLDTLCDTEDVTSGSRESGFKYTDKVVASDKTTHFLFALLADSYVRLPTLQFLTTLLHNRRQVIQSYFLTAPAGPGSIIAVLEDKRDVIRNEAITMVQALISQSPDIQKVLAFEGAFEKLFNIITQEGGVDGGLVAQSALTCVDGLLRFNNSNQSYFRETSLPPVLCALLQFPVSLDIQTTAPQEFALQFWDTDKQANTSLIVGIMGMLVGSKGHGVQETLPYTRCLIEMALASNAPTALKIQALRLLPTNINFPLSEISLTPYVPVPDTNGEEWDRLELASALDALIELAIHGEYNGLDAGKRTKESLELRTAAASVFENFVRKDEIRQAIVQSMVPPEDPDSPQRSRTTPLLHALASPPNTASALEPADVISTHIATLMFSHLLRSSPRAKASARLIIPGPLQPTHDQASNFFVPADGTPAEPAQEEPEDEDEPQTLLQILTENLSLALLSRSRTNASDREAREWDRYVVGYLCLLSQWLWEDPKSVKDFLDAGGLGVLVEPINQTSEVDSVVPGLCSFLLGICYEYNRQPGEITRATIHPIINRLSVDMLIGQMARFREDERFKSVGPDSIVLSFPPPSLQPSVKPAVGTLDEGEIWFDWAFVDFWKSNYYTVQRGFSTDPDQLSSSAGMHLSEELNGHHADLLSGQSAEATMLIASLRDVIRQQTGEIESLQKRLNEVNNVESQVAELQKQVESLHSQLASSETKRKDVEKEQEDLLVLLDEVTSKRRKDKARLREAGLEVSEDEADDDDDDDDEE